MQDNERREASGMCKCIFCLEMMAGEFQNGCSLGVFLKFKSLDIAQGNFGNQVSYNDKARSKVLDLYLKIWPIAALFSKYKRNLKIYKEKLDRIFIF